MKLAIDCREFVAGRTTGIGQFLRGILQEIAEHRPHLETVAVGLPDTPIPVQAPHLAVQRICQAPTLRCDQVLIPQALRATRATGFFSPYYKTPLHAPCPSIVTIHDLIPLEFPAYRTGRARVFAAAFQAWAALMARTARAIITDSQASKRSIEALLGVRGEKVHVQPLGIPPQFTPNQPDGAVAAVLAKHRLTRPYLLAVGNRLPHKNLDRLVDAYAALPAPLRTAVRLVLAGTAGGHGFARPVPDARLTRDGVTLLGYVPPADLPRLYKGATALVCPSFMEGFGLPVAEAMACGTPVVCANATSLPEVAGDAALYFDPRNTLEITAQLHRLLTSPALQRELAIKSLGRAPQFIPEITTRRLVDLLEQVARN